MIIWEQSFTYLVGGEVNLVFASHYQEAMVDQQDYAFNIDSALKSCIEDDVVFNSWRNKTHSSINNNSTKTLRKSSVSVGLGAIQEAGETSFSSHKKHKDVY